MKLNFHCIDQYQIEEFSKIYISHMYRFSNSSYTKEYCKKNKSLKQGTTKEERESETQN